MASTNIKFLNFGEAVEAAKKEPGVEFVALRYIPPFSRLDVYVIDVDSDEPDYTNVRYEGGDLFDTCGEEDFFSLGDVPAEVKNLFFVRAADLGNGDVQPMGMTSEFVLQAVLPGLTPDAKYRDQAHFMQVAGAEFQSFWRQV